MSNQIDGSGIQIQTLTEILNDIINGTANIPGLKQIYGDDINTDSNSPDGQLINIFALSKQDILDLIVQDYDSKDPDQAVGVALDALCQLCGIYRQGGTYTEVEVTVTTDRSLNLNGLDTAVPFTISDSNGNLFYLIISATLDSGANLLNFRAADIGYIQVLANTLTTTVDKILGIVNVNNISTPYQVGADQETDAQLRLRRQNSTALPAQGFLQSLEAGLSSIVGVAEAIVYENNESTVDTDGVPGHSIWVVVDGGTDENVAEMIYRYRNAGCGMKGNETVNVTQVDGSTFPIYFDRAVDEYLYIVLYIDSLSSTTIDEDALRTALAAAYTLGIYDEADITSITALVHEINPDLLVTDAGVKIAGGVYADSLFPSYKKNKFVLLAENISIISTGESSSSSSKSSSSSSSSVSSSSSCRSSSSKSSSSSSCRSSSSSCRSSSSSSRSSSSSSSSKG
jgi:uncharacterized phage protein gp47/JayE